MKDERQFATGKMDKVMNAEGLKINISADVSQAMKAIKKVKHTLNPPNYRRLLYIFLIPLLIIEWTVVMIYNLWEVVTNAVKEVALSLETYIHNANPISSGSQSEPET